MTQISFENVWMQYGAASVLENVSIDINDHEFLVVVGPSGVGKTTMLRLLLSQERPTRGRILLDGEPIAGEPTVDRGVVFQRYSVFPHKTVIENVMMGPQWRASPVTGRLFGQRKRDLEREANVILHRVGLGDSLNKYPALLSGGMQQRLALAQALINRPKVLLLDEPFGALDSGSRKSMHVLVRELWQEHRMTIMMITHDLAEAFLLGTRVIAIDKPAGDSHTRAVRGASIVADYRVKSHTIQEGFDFGETLAAAATQADAVLSKAEDNAKERVVQLAQRNRV